MHPRTHANQTSAKAALVDTATGLTVTYAELASRANQCARALRQAGLKRGDVVATLFANAPEVFVVGWAAQISGLYLTAISPKLSPADIGYILADSGAKLLIASNEHAGLARLVQEAAPPVPIYAWREGDHDLPVWTEVQDAQLSTAPVDLSPGTDLLYSSGTTGRPKGVKPALPEGEIDAPTPISEMGRSLYQMSGETIYLSTSPLYHAAPLRWAMAVQKLGGTVVIMNRFEPSEALRLVEVHGITHATFVPTHFVRMLKLPMDVRQSAGISSLKAVIHAAAPCPVPIKQAMIDWLGPIVHEYYSGTECCGITAINSDEWQAHPGSVGRAILGKVHIVDDDDNEVAAGTTGYVYFSDGPAFEYLNDSEKTRQAHNDRGWATLGDIGHIDREGFLYLTDRKSFMIISGGVNVYPQEIENALVTHPKVLDAAVIGVSDEELGEKVLAVVQPVPGIHANESLASELRAFCREVLGPVKTPKRFDFRAELPREPTGKLMKRQLIEEYRQTPDQV
jgi:long-chain acyl-CoA synthetase